MAAQTENRPNKRPGWMSIPGGPKEPSFQDFRAKMLALNTQKTKILDRLKEIQALFGTRDDSDRDVIVSERKELRALMTEIDAKRKKERDARSQKNEEISRTRRQRSEIENKLKELSNDLGAFSELSEIEMAIDHIMTKMETSGGGLGSEKRTIKRLSQLEEAKSLLLQLQPLQEAIAEADDREAALQQEYREIHERISTLNKEYDESFTVKQQKDKEVAKTSVDRTVIIKERDECRRQLTKLNEEMTQLRETFNSQREAWDAWREEARKKYTEKVEAERKEREQRWLERQNADKIARKKARALKRQNPHETEIAACSTLVRYLKDRQHMSQRDEEERQRRAAMSTFDPASCAPAGFALAAPIVPTKASKPRAQSGKQAEAKERPIQHNDEKARLFKLVGVASPTTMTAIDSTIEQLKKKQAEYESYIKSGDIELSSEDEEEEKEEAVAEEVVAA